jgi:hypothetical protein
MLARAFMGKNSYHTAMSLSHIQQKALARQWKTAAPALRRARHADIRRENNAQAMDALNSLYREAIKSRPARQTSGFVQMYRTLARQVN